MSSIRYGLVGSGYFGMALARGIAALPGAQISRVFDPENADTAVREFGCEAMQSVEAIASADDVDALIVASPNWAHVEPVLAAAREGKHIFCEKPIALSYRDCDLMVKAAEEADVLFMAGHVMNFMNGVRVSKDLIKNGIIGDVLFCRAIRNGWEEAQPKISWKKQRHLSGGHLYHHVHELDLVQFIMGPAVTASMAAGNVAHRGPGFGDEDDMLLITLEFDGDAFASLEYGSAFRWPEHYVLIQGSKGAIKIDLQDVGCTLRLPGHQEKFLLHRSAEEDDDRSRRYATSETDGAIQYGFPSDVPPLWLSGIVEEETAYFHSLMSGAPVQPDFAPLTNGSAARAAIATADALTLSVRERRKVDIAEIIASSKGDTR